MSTGVTRRSFLALSAAAAIPFTAMSRDRVVGANDTIRIGIIGAGRRGTALIREFTERADALHCRVTAVCDASAAARDDAAAICGARAYGDWQALIHSEDLDAVVIAAPDHWHAPMAIAAMKAGKDVYCETPMTRTLDEARAFRDTAVATGRVAQVGARACSESQWAAAREISASGRLGTLVWCQSSSNPRGAGASRTARARAQLTRREWEAFLGEAPRRSFDADRYLSWRNYSDYSQGEAADVLFQRLAPLLVAVGPESPVRVSAAGGVFARDGRETLDSLVMTCEYANGLKAVLTSSPALGQTLPSVVRGTDASLYLHGDRLAVECEPGREEAFHARFGVAPRATFDTPSSTDHVADWVDGMRERRPCACGEHVAYPAMVAVSMAIQACRESRTLRFDNTIGRAGATPARVV